ncbi:MAG: GTPase ObgE [Clostridia bacterium]|nr:GTPase ObgE [Clostridia bacterium]
MFIDSARIHIRAGKGGNGAVAFHREKYLPSGGPDGGDGGRGGSVIFVADDNLSTLMDFRYKKKYAAANGEDGAGKRCSGRKGEDLVIRVPRGTLIRSAENGYLIKDLSDDEPFVAARGGKGGWGNQHFATPTRQTPRFAKAGLPGEEFDIRLELKLLADVGLVGFPNVGKSTLLSVISSARPKIADYHFTTLTPNLGVVYVGEGASFVAADIPGIIEGASEGAGLGLEFLRHVDRCRLLLHVVDLSGSEGRDPAEDFHKIQAELARYSTLSERPQIVVANKADVDDSRWDALAAAAAEAGFPVRKISAATGDGVKELVGEVWNTLSSLPPVRVFEPEEIPAEVPDGIAEHGFTVSRNDRGDFVVEGAGLQHLVESTNFSDYESLSHMQKILRDVGVFDRLEAEGVKEGDTVVLYDLEFEYVK